MPKLGVFSGDEICRILESYGFRRVRQKGSHAIMQKETEDTTITVPVPLHRELKQGTLQSIIRHFLAASGNIGDWRQRPFFCGFREQLFQVDRGAGH